MQIQYLAGYKFIALTELSSIKENLLRLCESLEIKGTILLSTEGININISGDPEKLNAFRQYLQEYSIFADITFHEMYPLSIPYKHLRIKIKKELITMKKKEIDAVSLKAPSLAPETFKSWLDEKKDITILDTRNDYEVRFGTFKNAKHLQIKEFSDFPNSIDSIEKDKPVVMFCTGGIRCEKAALYMLDKGYSNVYQLEGGILNYFAKVGGEHFEGECFVFDERIAVDVNLKTSDVTQCKVCQAPVTKEQQSLPSYQPAISCPNCFKA